MMKTREYSAADMKSRGKLRAAMIAAAIVLSAITSASAADIETRLEQPEVAAGESTILSIRVSGSHDIEPGQPPRVPGLSMEYRGNVSSYEYVNGRTWSGTVVQYEVTPEKEGSFTIPPIGLKIDGRGAASAQVKITASGSAVANRRGGFPGFPNFPKIPGFPGFPDEDDRSSRRSGVRGEVALSKRSVFAGEPIVVRYNVVTDGSFTLKGFQSLPETAGFVRKDIDGNADTAEPGAGRRRVTSFIAVPQMTGSLTIGGGRAVLVDEDAWGPFSNVPVDFPAAAVEVKALPASGQPADFTGSVGTFVLKADAADLRCAAFEERRINVTLSGTGNFYGIQSPSFANLPSDVKCIASPGAENVQIEASGVRGEKSFVISIIPEKEGNFELGTLNFSYFDPSAGQYRTATAGPVRLTVQGVSERNSAPASGGRSVPVLLWIILGGAAVIGVFAGIVWYERRKYGIREDNPVKSLSDTGQPLVQPDKAGLSRLKYDLALARERRDGPAFLSSAEKLLFEYEKVFSDSEGAAAVRRELYPYRYGGRVCGPDQMTELEEKVLRLVGF